MILTNERERERRGEESVKEMDEIEADDIKMGQMCNDH